MYVYIIVHSKCISKQKGYLWFRGVYRSILLVCFRYMNYNQIILFSFNLETLIIFFSSNISYRTIQGFYFSYLCSGALEQLLSSGPLKHLATKVGFRKNLCMIPTSINVWFCLYLVYWRYSVERRVYTSTYEVNFLHPKIEVVSFFAVVKIHSPFC
jgi:hypothetical protein